MRSLTRGAQQIAAEGALSEATATASVWAAGDGQHLGAVLRAIQTRLSDIPPLENGAQVAHAAALAQVSAEIKRLEGVIAGDAANALALEKLEADIVQGQARLNQIDGELAGLARTNQDLANALAALAPHVHTDGCPVCGRDYKEVSEQPLAARLSARIAELSETAAPARGPVPGPGVQRRSRRRGRPERGPAQGPPPDRPGSGGAQARPCPV